MAQKPLPVHSDMMAAPFLAFVVGFALAWRGRQQLAIAVLVTALGLSLAMFLYHWTDTLPISL